MTDKVQKIREEVERLKLCTQSETLKQVLDYIDKVQEEPLSENLEEAALEHANNQLIKSGVTDTNCPRELAVAQASLMVNGFKAGAKWQKQQMANNLPMWKKGGIAGGHWSGEAYVSQGRKPQLVYETMHIDVNELVKKLPKEDGV